MTGKKGAKMSVKRTGVFSNWLPWLPGDTNEVEMGKVSRGIARCMVSRFANALLVLATIALLSGCGGGSDEAEVQSDEAQVQSVVKAERFEVVDKDGNVRAFLTTLEDGRPTLNLLDEKGESRAWLLLSNDGSPRLVLMDAPLLVRMAREAGVPTPINDALYAILKPWANRIEAALDLR